MILLDYPFVSDFLLETIEQFQFPVVATTEAKELAKNKNINWISEENAKAQIQENEEISIYTNSENSISWVQRNASGTRFPELIELFKNKYKFRQLIKDIYPDYFFQSVPFGDLESLDVSELKFPLIVKPAVGFFSIAVHKVDHAEDWPQTVAEIQLEIKRTQALYPKEVIDNTDFLLEEHVRGRICL